jgi:predicted deacetylase
MPRATDNRTVPKSPPAIVSIHDVSPATLPSVTALLEELRPQGCPRVTLLVIPGAEWSDRSLATLHDLQLAGHELAGHGWIHRQVDRRTLRHRLHSAFFSRTAAEHLSRPPADIADLIMRCHRWFGEHELGSPRLYVPPAWAMGRISRSDLEALPFRMYEYLFGVYDAELGVFQRLPLIGFEADTTFRALALKILNSVNWHLAKMLGRPLRVAIHPYDLRLRLAGDLPRRLAAIQTFLDYGACFPP